MNKHTQDFLNATCSNIKHTSIRDTIKNELYLHIEERKENYMNNGFNEVDAEKQSIKDMGEPRNISNEFNQLYKKKLDWKLLIIVGILIISNILLITTVYTKGNQNSEYLVTNITYLIIGIIASICMYFFNYQKINTYSFRIGDFRNNFQH